jgi:hypothetical protein
MIESIKNEDLVPHPKKGEKQEKVLDGEPHGEKIAQGDGSKSVIDRQKGHRKGAGHDEDVKYLESL